MNWLLWIGIPAAVLFLLCLQRVGVSVRAQDGALTADVRVSFLRFRVFPSRKKGEEAEKEPEADRKAALKAFPKPALPELRDAAKMLWPPLKRALARTRRGIRIDPLKVSVTLAGEADPAGTAQLYGLLQAGIWNGMPILEKLLDIREPSIHIGMDFTADKLQAEGETSVTARIGTLLAVGLTVAVPAIRWLVRYRRKKKQQMPAPQPAA